MRSARSNLIERYSKSESSLPLVIVLLLIGISLVVLFCISIGGNESEIKQEPQQEPRRAFPKYKVAPRSYPRETEEERERGWYELERNQRAIEQARGMGF